MGIDQNTRERPILSMIKALNILNSRNKRCQIVEIGCMRQPCKHSILDYSRPCCNDGHSTLFWLLSGHNISTCDIDPYAISMANSIQHLKPGNTQYSIHHQDGLQYLKNYSGNTIDLLFLDGWDVGSHMCAEMHMEAYLAAKPHLAKNHLILIDDTDVDYIDGECEFIDGANAGKGRLLIPYLLNNGYKMEFGGRQTLLSI